MTRYLGERYVSRRAAGDLEDEVARARAAARELARGGVPIALRWALFLPADETYFAFYEAPSLDVVRAAVAGAPLDRVVEAVALGTDRARRR